MASAWSKDLKITATINKALVAQCLSRYVPVSSHSHDDAVYGNKDIGGKRVRRKYTNKKTGESTIKGGWPRQGGRLKHALAHVPNWHLKNKGKECYNNIMLSYARAVIMGAQIPPVSFKNWGMHWADGNPVFRTRRRGYTIKQNTCLDRGLADFARGGSAAMNISWAKGTNTA
jgi:hypothetical protein